jgi:hypothetical protein
MRLFDLSPVPLRLDELVSALGEVGFSPSRMMRRETEEMLQPHHAAGPSPPPAAGPESPGCYVGWAIGIELCGRTAFRGKAVASYIQQSLQASISSMLPPSPVLRA